MKWVSHQLVTATGVYALTGSSLAAVLAGAFATLPDKIDILCGAFGGKAIHLFSHRKHSHYWGYWFIISACSLMYLKTHGLMLASAGEYVATLTSALDGNPRLACETILVNLAFWATLGSCLHIFEDFFSGMGVPLAVPTRISPHLRLYKTGSFSETLCTTVAVATGLYFSFAANVPYRESIRGAVSGLLFG